MDGVKGEVDAADLQEGYAGQPFVRQKQAHQRTGHRRQPRHQRQHQKAGGHNGAAHGLLHPFQIALLLGQDRQHHALDGAVHRVHQKLRELLAPVEIAQRLRGKLLADDKGTQVLVARIHQAGQQQLPAEGEQAPHPAKGKAEMRPPAHQNEQKDAQAELIGQLLPHQRPYAQPPQRHADAHAAGQHRGGQTGRHQLAEGHFSGNNCVLYAGQRSGEQDQRQHPQIPGQPLHAEKALHGGRGEEQCRIEQRRNGEPQKKHGASVGLVDLGPLDEGGVQAALHKHLRNGREDQQQGQNAVIVRGQQTAQHQTDHEGDALIAEALQQLEHEGGSRGLAAFLAHRVTPFRGSGRRCAPRRPPPVPGTGAASPPAGRPAGRWGSARSQSPDGSDSSRSP